MRACNPRGQIRFPAAHQLCQPKVRHSRPHLSVEENVRCLDVSMVDCRLDVVVQIREPLGHVDDDALPLRPCQRRAAKDVVVETAIRHVLVDEVSLIPFSGFFVIVVTTNAAASQQHEIPVAEVADDLYFVAEILVSLDIRLDDFLHRDWAPVREFSFVDNTESSFPDHVLRGEVFCGYL